MQFKPFPIGVENFEDMIRKNYYYVDKTLMIQELLDKKGYVNVFTRPRRFGKSLNISMLQYYFENLKKEDAHLFKGLKIEEAGGEYQEHRNNYPVIKLSLKAGEGINFAMAFANLKEEIGNEFNRHQYLLESGKLTENQKQHYQYVIKKSTAELLPEEKFESLQEKQQAELAELERQITVFSGSLKFLSQCLEHHFGKKVIILIDEYDVPLEKAHFAKKSYYEEMIVFIRALFGKALKTNDALEFAVITGCLRISKETIFTGLNNLNIVSIISHEYDEYFGFTEEEMNKMLKYYQLEAKEQEARDWYNGYLFGETIVYNPWSAIKYLADMRNREPFPKPHWSNTSSNSIIRQLIAIAEDDTKGEIESLIAGETITKPIHEDIVYSEITESMDNLWNFLFFTGYLKKVLKKQIGVHNYFELTIPNKEILYIYESRISKWFDARVKESDMTNLYTAFLNQDIPTFEDELIKLLGESISYMDSHENFYHGFLTGVLRGIEGYRVTSNRESGNGRGNIFIRPRDLRKSAIIIEVKVADKIQNLEKECDNALFQIEKKNYYEELKHEGYTEITKYGMAFFRKMCMIKTEEQR